MVADFTESDIANASCNAAWCILSLPYQIDSAMSIWTYRTQLSVKSTLTLTISFYLVNFSEIFYRFSFFFSFIFTSKAFIETVQFDKL